MIEFELDGKELSVEPGKTILEVALQEGKYIPHFCYHKKLSIAANCRMCLVEVEKSAKPLPACATPITDGMKVHTCSKMAVEAQKGVMEFLLINHPLDCPICDQGGECQLQDLAVGYGRSNSRFVEEKRVVTNKDLGPLVTTEMTRCIHCSRCVRFTDEIAGYQELGMSYRNNHVEVMPFIGKTVDSELSGNIIDICPVGALTSKPFSHQYRSWELSRRKSIAPHDGLGSNIIAQIDKYHKVVRVLPLDNEQLNECWLSDRDRFSYEGLYHEERAQSPQIKQDGVWHTVDWETALSYAAKSINGVKSSHGADAVGVLASAASTTEELYILQKLMRKIGINNIDSRLQQSDFSLDGSQLGAQYLGATINELITSKSILVIGSELRSEQPLVAHKIRKAVKNGSTLHVVSTIKENLLCESGQQVTCDPRQIVDFVAQIVKASASLNQSVVAAHINLENVVVSDQALAIAQSLVKDKGYIVLGEIAKSLPDYSKILLLTQQLASNVGGNFGVLGRANDVGANLVGFVPYVGAFNQTLNKSQQGLAVSDMLKASLKAYVLLNTELELDSYNAQAALEALHKAQTVVVLSAFVNKHMLEYADVILPITPYTETAGSYVNMQGMWQKFNGVTKPLNDAKPGWKVLRVLANHLIADSTEFVYNSIEDVRNELSALNDTKALLNNAIAINNLKVTVDSVKLNGLVRVSTTDIYGGDSITRRATSLQQTPQAQSPLIKISAYLASKLNLQDADQVIIKQDGAEMQHTLRVCDSVPNDVVFVRSNCHTTKLGGRFASIEIWKK